jgi:hypothetical protein
MEPPYRLHTYVSVFLYLLLTYILDSTIDFHWPFYGRTGRQEGMPLACPTVLLCVRDLN